MWAAEALDVTIDSLTPGSRVLDIGSGPGEHSRAFEAAGFHVEQCDLDGGEGRRYEDMPPDLEGFGCIWASHVVEHLADLQANLVKMRLDLKAGGLLAVTVPPLKHEIVGGHVNLFNAGLLLYRLILAGFDCRDAAVKQYGYNISVLVRRVDIDPFPQLRMDSGDIDKLAVYFPFPVREGFNGQIIRHNWSPRL